MLSKVFQRLLNTISLASEEGVVLQIFICSLLNIISIQYLTICFV